MVSLVHCQCHFDEVASVRDYLKMCPDFASRVAHLGEEGGGRGAERVERSAPRLSIRFIYQSVLKSQLPHKIVNLVFTITN